LNIFREDDPENNKKALKPPTPCARLDEFISWDAGRAGLVLFCFVLFLQYWGLNSGPTL
jgi:hypothetical protein